MDRKVKFKTSFTIDDGTLTLVDEFCQEHDLTRSQAIRRGLKLLMGDEYVPTASIILERPRAPRPRQVA